jgi:glutathione S-transferase
MYRLRFQVPPVLRSSLRYTTMSKPTLTLYTAATPNGYKVSTLLGKVGAHQFIRSLLIPRGNRGLSTEELKLAYPDSGLSYDLKELSFQRNEQKEPSYLKVIPILRSHDSNLTFYLVKLPD